VQLNGISSLQVQQDDDHASQGRKREKSQNCITIIEVCASHGMVQYKLCLILCV
jgi:hypothetical protein